MKKKQLKQINLNLCPSVKLYYGFDIKTKFADILSAYSFDKIVFVSDPVAYKFHGKALYELLLQRKIDIELLFIESIEDNKTFSQVEYLCETLLSRGITKSSIIISFGGGLIGNICGLAAGLIYRGIRYIEIPTTFMGQTDSTLSNKQAVNGKNGKNQIGMYYAPVFVWSDIEYVTTESIQHINAAIVEGIKNTFIFDTSIRKELIEFVQGKSIYTNSDLYYLFETIIKSKNRILYCDSSEKDFAVILEYGHTFGHAIEFITHGRIIHGEAVALGMCMAAELSRLMGGLKDDEVKKHYNTLLPFFVQSEDNKEIVKRISPEMIFDAIQNDNKKDHLGVKYVLLESFGKCMNESNDYQMAVSKDMVLLAIKKTLNVLKTYN